MPVYPAPVPVGQSAPVGAYQYANNYLNNAAAVVTSGTVLFSPFDIGPTPKNFDQLAVGCTTAQVAGTTTTTMGLYPDDGTGSGPRLTGGPTYSGTLTLTALGNRAATVTITGIRGRWWCAFLYVATVAPTTVGQVNMIGSAAPALYNTTGNTIGTVSRGLSLAGQTVLPTSSATLAQVGGSTCPVMALRAA